VDRQSIHVSRKPMDRYLRPGGTHRHLPGLPTSSPAAKPRRCGGSSLVETNLRMGVDILTTARNSGAMSNPREQAVFLMNGCRRDRPRVRHPWRSLNAVGIVVRDEVRSPERSFNGVWSSSMLGLRLKRSSALDAGNEIAVSARTSTPAAQRRHSMPGDTWSGKLCCAAGEWLFVRPRWQIATCQRLDGKASVRGSTSANAAPAQKTMSNLGPGSSLSTVTAFCPAFRWRNGRGSSGSVP
jgi:hypothetical protein